MVAAPPVSSPPLNNKAQSSGGFGPVGTRSPSNSKVRFRGTDAARAPGIAINPATSTAIHSSNALDRQREMISAIADDETTDVDENFICLCLSSFGASFRPSPTDPWCQYSNHYCPITGLAPV